MSATREVAEDVNDNVWLERGARLGLVAYGIVHMLIAWLALQLVFGERSGAPSERGAMQELAQKPFGDVLLWVVAFGFACLVVWQAIEAIVGHRKYDKPKRTFKRLGSAARVVIYAVFGLSAGRTALGETSTSKQDHITAEVMKLPLGQVLVCIGGVAVICVGGYLVYKGFSRRFEDDLEPSATSGDSGTAAVTLAQIGYPAKGVAFAVLGVLFVIAGLTFDPDKAGGLDVALRTLLEQPLGPWLLGAVAVGIGCFGVYCFFWAKYADISA